MAQPKAYSGQPATVADLKELLPANSTMQTPLASRPTLSSRMKAVTNGTRTERQPTKIQNGLDSRLKKCSTLQPAVSRLNQTTTITTTSSNTMRPQVSSQIPRNKILSNTVAKAAPQTSFKPQIQRQLSTASTATTTSIKTSATTTAARTVASTAIVRKGLAKFANPIECQRQFQAFTERVTHLEEALASRKKELDDTRNNFERAIDLGVGYAIVVQYFAVKLKLDSDMDLVAECGQLKSQLGKFSTREAQFEERLQSVIDDYKTHIDTELDLRRAIEAEFEQSRVEHAQRLTTLENEHKEHLDGLETQHAAVKDELVSRIGSLESELQTRNRDYTDLKKEHEFLNEKFNKLEETLTKDKDARVKYYQEKNVQLQKDVESLNSVLDMKTERIHLLDKENIRLAECEEQLLASQETNKTLRQQLESANLALETKRKQVENLTVELEQLRQTLTLEHKERRRMTMKSEQLEYALNESVASDANE